MVLLLLTALHALHSFMPSDFLSLHYFPTLIIIVDVVGGLSLLAPLSPPFILYLYFSVPYLYGTRHIPTPDHYRFGSDSLPTHFFFFAPTDLPRNEFANNHFCCSMNMSFLARFAVFSIIIMFQKAYYESTITIFFSL